MSGKPLRVTLDCIEYSATSLRFTPRSPESPNFSEGKIERRV